TATARGANTSSAAGTDPAATTATADSSATAEQAHTEPAEQQPSTEQASTSTAGSSAGTTAANSAQKKSQSKSTAKKSSAKTDTSASKGAEKTPETSGDADDTGAGESSDEDAEFDAAGLADLDGVEVDVVDATVTEDEQTGETEEIADVKAPSEEEEAKAATDPDFVWDEEESEALRQARKDAELTASADSVRAYLKQIGKVALLNAEEEVELAKRIEAGLYATWHMGQVAERGDKLTAAQRRDFRWIERDGMRAKNHLLEAN